MENSFASFPCDRMEAEAVSTLRFQFLSERSVPVWQSSLECKLHFVGRSLGWFVVGVCRSCCDSVQFEMQFSVELVGFFSSIFLEIIWASECVSVWHVFGMVRCDAGRFCSSVSYCTIPSLTVNYEKSSIEWITNAEIGALQSLDCKELPAIRKLYVE